MSTGFLAHDDRHGLGQKLVWQLLRATFVHAAGFRLLRGVGLLNK